MCAYIYIYIYIYIEVSGVTVHVGCALVGAAEASEDFRHI